MLPSLIAETGLLSFISRQHLTTGDAQGRLCEIPIPAVTMERHLVVTHRVDSYLSPAAELLMALLGRAAQSSG